MKINNLKQFREMLNFCFSEGFTRLNESEQESLRNMIKSAIGNIDGAICEMKTIAKCELHEGNFYSKYSGQLRKEKVLFVMSTISDEDKIEIITKYLEGPKEEDESYWSIEKEILFDMLEFLSENLQIEILSKSNPAELFKFMSEYNHSLEYLLDTKGLFLKKHEKQRIEECKKRYNICKQALAK